MAKLERPKGYSRKLWKKLQNQIRNIKRFVREKTKSGVEIKSKPNTEDVYTKEGRKRIREWSAREQWKQSEYVDRETGEILTGAEARRKWMEDRARQREEANQPEDAPDYSLYESILERLQEIPNERVFKTKTGVVYKDTGGVRDILIDMLNDIADNTDYLKANESQIEEHTRKVCYDSKQMNVEYSVTVLLSIFNRGAISQEQWNTMQGLESWTNYSDYI